jgi:hypothetical protein
MLFDCNLFSRERIAFENSTGKGFDFEVLLEDNVDVAKAAVEVGCRIYDRVAQFCLSQ